MSKTRPIAVLLCAALLASCSSKRGQDERPQPSSKPQSPSSLAPAQAQSPSPLSAELRLANASLPFTEPDKAYRTAMASSAPPRTPPTAAQAVGAILRIRNTSDTPRFFAKSGDGISLRLSLAGKDAWNGGISLPCPEIRMLPTPQLLPPNGFFDLAIPTLVSGDRCDIHLAQANAPGDYVLNATFTTFTAATEDGLNTGTSTELVAPSVALSYTSP